MVQSKMAEALILIDVIVDLSCCVFCILTSRAQAQPPSETMKTKMTNIFHKINRNWQGQRLLPAAIC
jgi:hypothetical protein